MKHLFFSSGYSLQNGLNNLENRYWLKPIGGLTGNRPNQYYITSLGGGTGLREIVIPTAPGVRFPHQPPSQRSLRHQLHFRLFNI